ncbi:VOC family protein [Actinoplanes sp. NPDC051411]|uniref:VOC family protein n=1 Tax=Actinoplanes sp. NPDC051411 TaxID=3155522 RepID=UPI003432C745
MGMFQEPQLILFSDDVTRITQFYEKLGFTEAFRVPAEGEPIHVDLTLDGYKIGFSSVDSTRDDHGLDPVSGVQHTAVVLWTSDTAAAYEHVVALGSPPIKGPHVWLGRLLIAWTADPDGNPIQIVQSL